MAELTFAASPTATVTFVMSFLAIVPLAALLGFATEEIALRVSPVEATSARRGVS